jgi:hypothetical protein
MARGDPPLARALVQQGIYGSAGHGTEYYLREDSLRATGYTGSVYLWNYEAVVTLRAPASSL